MPHRIAPFAVLTWLVTIPVAGHAQQQQGSAAMLFAYRPHAGQRAAFDSGYRAHLEWHRQAGDTLIWYAWDVLTGDHIDRFVDGVFAAPLEAVDQRVDPGGDRRNFAATAGPHAEPLYRQVYALRADLSTDLFLEQRRPSPLMQVFTVEVVAGGETAVEELFRAARGERGPAMAVYEAVDGGSLPRYLVLAPRQGLRQLTTLAALLGAGSVEGWAQVRHVRSETWRYRADLTYLP